MIVDRLEVICKRYEQIGEQLSDSTKNVRYAYIQKTRLLQHGS